MGVKEDKLHYLEELDEFQLIRRGHVKNIEKFADLLNFAVINSAENNGWSTVNDFRKLSFDRLKYVMTGYSDRRHLVYLQCVFFL